MSPSPAAFSNQNVGATSSPLTVTVSNTGTGAQILATPYFTITGTNATNFANAGTGTCVNGGTIAPSSSCTVNLTFTPSASGARSATLTIQGTVIATDSLTGTGIAPVISIAPSPIAFANQNVNTTSGPLTVTISNTGTASEILATPYFTITGTNAGDFTNAGTGTCANGGTIATSSSCTVNLTFTPSALGSRTANLNILGTVNGLASITGTGLQAKTSFSPLSIAFANQNTGSSSGNHAVTLTNTGNATLTITGISLTGPNASEFSTNGSTCGGTLGASLSCSINVVFSPLTATSKTANLTFVTSAPTSPDNVRIDRNWCCSANSIAEFFTESSSFRQSTCRDERVFDGYGFKRRNGRRKLKYSLLFHHWAERLCFCKRWYRNLYGWRNHRRERLMYGEPHFYAVRNGSYVCGTDHQRHGQRDGLSDRNWRDANHRSGAVSCGLWQSERGHNQLAFDGDCL